MTNSKTFQEAFDALLSTYAERLTGDGSDERVQKIKIWALYNHMHKTMPALTNHWNASHPEAKQTMKKLFEEVKALNERHRSNSATSD